MASKERIETEREHQHSGKRRHEQRRVDAVEHAAMAGNQTAAVLAAHAPLDPRLEQIARMRGDRQSTPRIAAFQPLPWSRVT